MPSLLCGGNGAPGHVHSLKSFTVLFSWCELVTSTRSDYHLFFDSQTVSPILGLLRIQIIHIEFVYVWIYTRYIFLGKRICSYSSKVLLVTLHTRWPAPICLRLPQHLAGLAQSRRRWQPLQRSCLENPRDRGVHGVAEGQTRLSNFTFTFHFHALQKEMATHSSVLAWRQGRGAWWAAVYGVAQNQTRLKRLSSSILNIFLKGLVKL